MESSVLYSHARIFFPSLFCADEGMSSELYSHAPIFVRSPYYADLGICDQVWVVGHSPGFLADGIPLSIPSVCIDDVYGDEAINDSVTRRKERKMDFEALGLLKRREPHGRAKIPRHCVKAPKIVSKARPRLIHQPR